MDINSVTFQKAIEDACHAGIELEKNRWVETIGSKICFDHYQRGCNHPECYVLEDLIETMTLSVCSLCDGEGVVDEGDVDGVATVSKCSFCG